MGNIMIMISYQRSNRKEILRIRDNLKSHGYRVCVDVDNMGGSTLQSMAEVIESANIVLVCISRKYKESANCKIEAEYAYELRKVIIPLLMERNYQPDGWLGVLIGARRMYDFSGKYPFESQFKYLLTEISQKYGKGQPSDNIDNASSVEDVEAYLTTEQQEKSSIPDEILRMDEQSVNIFKEALKEGMEKVYNIRLMVVGPYNVGKTTLIQRLLGQSVDITRRQSTEGIDVHVLCCKVSLDTHEWIVEERDSEEIIRLQRLANLLSKPAVNADQQVMVKNTPVQQERATNAVMEHCSNQQASEEVKHNTPEKQNKIHGQNWQENPIMEILKSLKQNAPKLQRATIKEMAAALSMWDFAGQYSFYTTHQTFLTRRALYLLVTDASQHITDDVRGDECYFDAKGLTSCKTQDLVDVWLNSIHSCSPPSDAGTPPVILVGTHTDKIPLESREKVCSNYFQQIRRHLKSKPTRFHLADEDFPINNSIDDPNLDKLKKKIVELAAKQSYWGEPVPARWLTLEQELMKLKAAGLKVIPRKLVEELNQIGPVPIQSGEELELFLRFQHEMGTILYFSTEELRVNIVLDPQWMIHALKSLITAKMFILKTVFIDKWDEFEQNGKLTEELIDAIWSEETNPELYQNKGHLIKLMLRMNIIVKPKSYNEDHTKVMEEKFYLAPCMLRQATPKDIVSAEPDSQRTPVLCFEFADHFLPSPVFHRLVAACVGRWPIAKTKNNSLIFCGCCILDLDDAHRLTIYFREYIIFVRVSKTGIKDKTPQTNLCIDARKFITKKLEDIIGSLGQNLKFVLHIQCPEVRDWSPEGLLPVTHLKEKEETVCNSHGRHAVSSHDLVKFWFEDESEAHRAEKGEDKRNKHEAVRSSGLTTTHATKSKTTGCHAGDDAEKGHVMISYDWGHQQKVFWIRDQIRNNGYSIWIDVDKIENKLSKDMAIGVKGAHVVLLCMSERYEKSKACSKEAHYADKRGKILIPLKMETGPIPDNWLEFFTSDLKYIDFTGEKKSLEDMMKELLKVLAKSYGKKYEDPTIEPFIKWDAKQPKKKHGAASGSAQK